MTTEVIEVEPKVKNRGGVRDPEDSGGVGASRSRGGVQWNQRDKGMWHSQGSAVLRWRQ